MGLFKKLSKLAVKEVKTNTKKAVKDVSKNVEKKTGRTLKKEKVKQNKKVKPQLTDEEKKDIEIKESTIAHIPFAFREDEENGGEVPVYLDSRCHTLFSGVSGSGKSVTLNTVLSGLAKVGPDYSVDGEDFNKDGTPYKGSYVALVAADLKGGIELVPWLDRLSFLATKHNEVDFLLDRLREENERRQDIVVDNEWHDFIPSKTMPLIILIIDELAELVASRVGVKENAQNADALKSYKLARTDDNRKDAIRSLSQTGRSQGIFIYAATQSPRAELIDGVLRAQLEQKLLHRVTNKIECSICVGTGNEDEYPCHKLPADQGMMYAMLKKHNDPILCRAMYTVDGEAKAIASQNASKKCYLSFLKMPPDMYAQSRMGRSNAKKKREVKQQNEAAIGFEMPPQHITTDTANTDTDIIDEVENVEVVEVEEVENDDDCFSPVEPDIEPDAADIIYDFTTMSDVDDILDFTAAPTDDEDDDFLEVVEVVVDDFKEIADVLDSQTVELVDEPLQTAIVETISPGEVIDQIENVEVEVVRDPRTSNNAAADQYLESIIAKWDIVEEIENEETLSDLVPLSADDLSMLGLSNDIFDTTTATTTESDTQSKKTINRRKLEVSEPVGQLNFEPLVRTDKTTNDKKTNEKEEMDAADLEFLNSFFNN